jgi:hypothetical protein
VYDRARTQIQTVGNSDSIASPPTWRRKIFARNDYLGARAVSNLDKQRVAAVRKPEAPGYSYGGGEWVLASALPAA